MLTKSLSQEIFNKHYEEYSIPVYTNLRNNNKRCNLEFNIYILINFQTIFLLSLKKVFKFLYKDGEHTEQPNINEV